LTIFTSLCMLCRVFLCQCVFATLYVGFLSSFPLFSLYGVYCLQPLFVCLLLLLYAFSIAYISFLVFYSSLSKIWRRLHHRTLSDTSGISDT
jgi:hypothetical protein